MVPTLRDRDVVVFRPGGRPVPGAVVLVRWPSRPGRLSVKRAVRRDGAAWHVEGDNTFGSTDSRELGPAEVVGIVHWRLWPNPGRIR